MCTFPKLKNASLFETVNSKQKTDFWKSKAKLGLRVGLRAGFLKACGRDPAGLKRLNFVDKKLVKTINAFIMYKIVSFFHASIDDKKFCRINKSF